MNILGIDPGLHNCGYGITSIKNGTIIHITHGVIKLKKETSLEKKLALIFFKLKEIIEYYDVQRIAVETVFVGKNVDSALKLSLCRGCIITLAGVNNIKLMQLTPSSAKKITTGNGAAKKTQVNRAIKKILNITQDIELDASDALSISIGGGAQILKEL